MKGLELKAFDDDVLAVVDLGKPEVTAEHHAFGVELDALLPDWS